MKTIPLTATPNQSFTVRLDQSLYTFVIKETAGVMSASISRDDAILLSFTRMTADAPLIPYQYLADGNFFLLTEDAALPDYTQFGVTQTLIYLTADEIEAARAGA